MFSAALQGERVLRVAEMYHKLENEQRSVTSALFLAEEPEGGGPETPGEAEVTFFPLLQGVKVKHSVGTKTYVDTFTSSS